MPRGVDIEKAVFLMGIGFGDEFRKRGIEMDIVRNKQTAIAQAVPEFAEFPEHVLEPMRTVVEKHIDRFRNLVALDQIAHVTGKWNELIPKFIRN
jgi:hypothetical protein